MRMSILLPCLRLQHGLRCSFPNPRHDGEKWGEEPEAVGEKFVYVVSPEGSFGVECDGAAQWWWGIARTLPPQWK